jgi:hypothetical protein
VTEIILFAVVGPFALFMIALLFIVAGILARPSLERKGPARFAADRLLRLGVPFLVRLVYPFGSESFTDLNLWEWPACIALFAVGIAGSRHGWLTGVPDRLRRQCRLITLVAAAAMAAFGFTAAQLGLLEQHLGGWNWPALVLAAIESMLTVFGSVWLLAEARRHLSRRLPLGPRLARSSYGPSWCRALSLSDWRLS